MAKHRILLYDYKFSNKDLYPLKMKIEKFTVVLMNKTTKSLLMHYHLLVKHILVFANLSKNLL